MTDPKRSSRRDFLKGKPARDSISEKFETPTPSPAAESSNQNEDMRRQAAYLEQYSKNAMACEFEIFFNMHQYTQSGIAVATAFQLIDAIEEQMTVYRSHSEVSRINRLDKNEWMPVEAHLFGLLSLAVEIFDETGGAFDITSGPLSKLWKFDERSGAIPEPSEIEVTLQQVGSTLLQLDTGNQSVCPAREDVQTDLGGIGKGHALDRVAQSFRDVGIHDFVIHGGQSSVLAGGHSVAMKPDEGQSSDGNDGWRVGISHPTLPGVRLAEVTLCDQALGTSGTGRQGFYHQGKRYGHIIDPRTGWPSSHVLSSTVITKSAARADALATAFFVMSTEEVAAFCDSHPDVGALLVVPMGNKGQVTIKTFNLPEENLQLESSVAD